MLRVAQGITQNQPGAEALPADAPARNVPRRASTFTRLRKGVRRNIGRVAAPRLSMSRKLGDDQTVAGAKSRFIQAPVIATGQKSVHQQQGWFADRVDQETHGMAIDFVHDRYLDAWRAL